MRITPLAVFCHNLSKEDLKLAVYLQTYLTHSNEIALEACFLYCLAIQHLIKNPNDNKGAYEKAKKESILLKTWFDEIESQRFPNSKEKIGWLKIAFTHAFSFLKKANECKYEDILRKTLELGGDTDTNAAIVGGLVGAYYGEDGVPDDMK